jgi:hypothetical protein
MFSDRCVELPGTMFELLLPLFRGLFVYGTHVLTSGVRIVHGVQVFAVHDLNY